MLVTRAGMSEDQSTITGVDIGTGASSIYPLLGCAISSNLRFIATDIDTHSLQHARTNIAQNNLDDRIHVVQVSADGPIFAPSIFDISSHIDFTMCNPPFYSDREEVLRSAEAKELGPNAVCTGADTEMITPGGEVMFVRRMVEESLVLKTQCRWYSSMLGKMSSLIDVVELLRTRQVENYAVTEFIQGKTRRWAIAWSFTDERLPDSFARTSNPVLHSIMPPRNTLKQSFSGVSSTDELLDAVKLVLPVIDSVTFDTVVRNDKARAGSSRQLMVHASGNTWSRAARRKKLLGTPVHPTGNIAPALICLITAVQITETAGEQFALEFQWIRGESRELFESFMAHVSRKVEAALKSSGDSMVS